MSAGPNSPSLFTQVTYGNGQIAGQVMRDVPSLLLLFFMTNTLGIPAAVAGTAIFVPKLLVAASSDILVGVVADRFKAKLPFYWWLLFGAILAPVAMLLLFNVPDASQGFQVGYIAAVLSLYMAVFASFSVPYLAIAAALSNDPHQRTVLMAWRLVFTAIGILVAGGLAPSLIDQWGGDRRAYSLLSGLLAAVCSVSLIIAFIGSRKALKAADFTAKDTVSSSLNFGEMLKAVSLPRFSVLLTANIIQLTGTGMSYAAMLYFLTYAMAIENPFGAIGIVIALTTLGIIVAQPMWVALSKRSSKKTIYIAGSILHGVVIALWGLSAGVVGIYGAYFLSFLVGVANSGWAMLGFSMVADIAGKSRSGLFSSIWIAADKIGFALGGTFLIGLTLSTFGFDSAKAVAGVAQSSGAITGTVVAFAFIPAAFYFVGATIMGIWGQDTEPEAETE